MHSYNVIEFQEIYKGGHFKSMYAYLFVYCTFEVHILKCNAIVKLNSRTHYGNTGIIELVSTFRFLFWIPVC